jgi:hypothetical protein
MAHRNNQRIRTRRIIFWAVVFTVISQIGFSFALPWWHPDTEFRLRKELIQARVAEDPNRPLFVMIGSSRVVGGFNPDDLSDITSTTGQKVLCFNFGHVEAGPVCNLIQLKRLLHAGIKPKWLIVEIAPMYCADERNLFVHNLSWEDIDTVARFHPYQKFTGSFLRNHFLAPWFRYRGDLQERYLGEHPPRPVQCNLSSFGWGGSLEVVEPKQREEWTERARVMFAPVLGKGFRIAPMAHRAYRELLALCQKEHIEVALLMMPEGNNFQSWYTPVAQERLQEFINELVREYGVAVHDARSWFDDSFFADSHHLAREGTRQFSQRLEREILRTWICPSK